LLLPLTAIGAQTNCALADDLIYRANDLYNRNAPVQQQMDLLRYAIEVCPTNVYARNNLAFHLGDQKQYAAAIAQYKQALAIKPTFTQAWYGLGEAYQTWGKLPQALEAYLHACTQDKDARKRITALLKDKRFASVEANRILTREELAILFDPARRAKMRQMLKACNFDLRAVMDMQPVFRNLEFATGKAELAPTDANRTQVREIGAALLQVASNREIYIEGHSDDQPFHDVSPAESKRLNKELSIKRANNIRTSLIAEGVASHKIIARGYGDEQPVSQNRARNRRVEIKVQ